MYKAFLHFVPNFWHIRWFFKVSQHQKYEEMPCSNCRLKTHFSMEIPKPETQVSSEQQYLHTYQLPTSELTSLALCLCKFVCMIEKWMYVKQWDPLERYRVMNVRRLFFLAFPYYFVRNYDAKRWISKPLHIINQICIVHWLHCKLKSEGSAI